MPPCGPGYGGAPRAATGFAGTRWYPRQESNLRAWFRKPLLCPLSYGGTRLQRSRSRASAGAGANLRRCSGSAARCRQTVGTALPLRVRRKR